MTLEERATALLERLKGNRDRDLCLIMNQLCMVERETLERAAKIAAAAGKYTVARLILNEVERSIQVTEPKEAPCPTETINTVTSEKTSKDCSCGTGVDWAHEPGCASTTQHVTEKDGK
jgi:hypothetical protein